MSAAARARLFREELFRACARAAQPLIGVPLPPGLVPAPPWPAARAPHCAAAPPDPHPSVWPGGGAGPRPRRPHLSTWPPLPRGKTPPATDKKRLPLFTANPKRRHWAPVGGCTRRGQRQGRAKGGLGLCMRKGAQTWGGARTKLGRGARAAKAGPAPVQSRGRAQPMMVAVCAQWPLARATAWGARARARTPKREHARARGAPAKLTRSVWAVARRSAHAAAGGGRLTDGLGSTEVGAGEGGRQCFG